MYNKVAYASGMSGYLLKLNGQIVFKRNDGALFFFSHSDPMISILEPLDFYYDKKGDEFIVCKQGVIEYDTDRYISMPIESQGVFLRCMDYKKSNSLTENFLSCIIGGSTIYDEDGKNRIYTIKVESLKISLGPDNDIACWYFTEPQENFKNFLGKIDHTPTTLGISKVIDGYWDKYENKS